MKKGSGLAPPVVSKATLFLYSFILPCTDCVNSMFLTWNLYQTIIQSINRHNHSEELCSASLVFAPPPFFLSSSEHRSQDQYCSAVCCTCNAWHGVNQPICLLLWHTYCSHQGLISVRLRSIFLDWKSILYLYIWQSFVQKWEKLFVRKKEPFLPQGNNNSI